MRSLANATEISSTFVPVTFYRIGNLRSNRLSSGKIIIDIYNSKADLKFMDLNTVFLN